MAAAAWSVQPMASLVTAVMDLPGGDRAAMAGLVPMVVPVAAEAMAAPVLTVVPAAVAEVMAALALTVVPAAEEVMAVPALTAVPAAVVQAMAPARMVVPVAAAHAMAVRAAAVQAMVDLAPMVAPAAVQKDMASQVLMAEVAAHIRRTDFTLKGSRKRPFFFVSPLALDRAFASSVSKGPKRRTRSVWLRDRREAAPP